MYLDLIKSYVQAINNGAVPAIESAWTYICSNECQKASSEALENYEQVLKEILHNKFPLPFEELKSYHKMAKDSAMAVFSQKSIGESVEDHKKDLSRKIKMRFK